LPPAPVALYLDALVQQGKKLATIARRLAAIRFAHRAAEEEDPVGRTLVVATWQGIRRTLGRAQTHKAALLYRRAPPGDEQRMMEQSGHRSLEVAQRYIRRGKIWDEHPAYRVGL
jgi:hypothetical protein